MEMLKKSGIALVLGSLMLASIPTTTQCLNVSRKNVLTALGATTIAALCLLHFQEYLPNTVTNNSLFKTIIGTPKHDEKLEVIGLTVDNMYKVRTKPSEPSTGFVGRFESLLSGPLDKAYKNWALIAAIIKLYTETMNQGS